MENSIEREAEKADLSKSDVGSSNSISWQDRLLNQGLTSPIYVFIFLILFLDGADEIDLHDAIIRFIANFNSI